MFIENANFSYPRLFNLHDPLEPFEFLPKILIQTIRIHELFNGAKILLKKN